MPATAASPAPGQRNTGSVTNAEYQVMNVEGSEFSL